MLKESRTRRCHSRLAAGAHVFTVWPGIGCGFGNRSGSGNSRSAFEIAADSSLGLTIEGVAVTDPQGYTASRYTQAWKDPGLELPLCSRAAYGCGARTAVADRSSKGGYECELVVRSVVSGWSGGRRDTRWEPTCSTS